MVALTDPAILATLVNVLLACFEANLKILTMVVLGALATISGVFDSRGLSDLGRLVYRISLPSLIFSKILKFFSLNHLLLISWLPVFCVIHTLVAYGVSKAMIWVLRVPEAERRCVVGANMFGNVGALCLAVMSTLCTSEPLQSEVGAVCESRGMSFSAFYLITQNLIMFSWGESLLFGVEGPSDEPPAIPEEPEEEEPTLDSPAVSDAAAAPNFVHSGPASYCSLDEAELPASVPPRLRFSKREGARGGGMLRGRAATSILSRPLMGGDGGRPSSIVVKRSSSTAALADDAALSSPRRNLSYKEIQSVGSRCNLEVHAFHPFHHESAKVLAGLAADEGSGRASEKTLLDDDKSNRFEVRFLHRGTFFRDWVWLCWMRLRSVVWGVLRNPPIQAALVAIALAAWPPLKSLLAGSEAPLRFITEAIETLGQAQVPISMLLLSGSGTLNYMKRLRTELQSAGAAITPFSFSARTEAAVYVGRLVLNPAVAFGICACDPSYAGKCRVCPPVS